MFNAWTTHNKLELTDTRFYQFVQVNWEMRIAAKQKSDPRFSEGCLCFQQRQATKSETLAGGEERAWALLF